MNLAPIPSLGLSSAGGSAFPDVFETLMAELDRHSCFDLRHLQDFMLPVRADTCRIAIRCDMAGDPAWTLSMARLAARYAWPLTVFVNNREAYFMQDGWLGELIVAGPEIGLKLIPWMEEDKTPDQAPAAVARAIARLRDTFVDLRGFAFDPPCYGVPAEGYEIVKGLGREGRNLPVNFLDVGAFNLGYTTMFGRPKQAGEAETAAYFAATTSAEYQAASLWQSFLCVNPLWAWEEIIIFVLARDGIWVRYRTGSTDLPVLHAKLGDAVDWIANNGKGRRFLFHLDPRVAFDKSNGAGGP